MGKRTGKPYGRPPKFEEKEFTSQKWGKLQPIRKTFELDKQGRKRVAWECVCDCGNEITRSQTNLIQEEGRYHSCGKCPDIRGFVHLSDEEIKSRKFGKLTPIRKFFKISNFRKNKAYWECKCDCGNKELIVRRQDYLVSKQEKYIHSCGCEAYYSAVGEKNKNWKGYGEISGNFFSRLKRRDRKTKVEFNISIEFLWKLFLKQDRKCALTGLPLQFKSYSQNRRGSEQTASLDRIDSSKGYIEGNVQWVHKDVNIMKNIYGIDYFKKICNLIAEKHPIPTYY